MTPGPVVGVEPLLEAQGAALTHDQRLDTLKLDAIAKNVPSLQLAESLVAARVSLTMDGASTLDLSIHDPEWLIEESMVLNRTDSGRLQAHRVLVDKLAFRLVKASRRDPSTLALTFEDEAVVLLRQHDAFLAASRGSVTRAQFIERLVREVKVKELPFWSPEKGTKQAVETPDFPDRPVRGNGFPDDVKFTIKGQPADRAQLRDVEIVMGICDVTPGVTDRVRLAALVAGIGESEFRRGAKDWKTGTHVGVFQSNQIPAEDLAGQAHYFLVGGRSFLAGGAIGLAKANPGMSVGEIAARVEISDGAAAYYQGFHDEAKKIAGLWKSGDATSSDDRQVISVKAFQFTRGRPGERETSWDAGVRLAEDVGWRFFAMGGVVWFVSDDYLISHRPSLRIALDDPALIEPPTYDWDQGKSLAEVGLQVSANRWGVRPAEIVELQDMGPISGAWIVHSVDMNLLDATETQVTLIKPVEAKKEPAPDVTTSTQDKDAQTKGHRPASTSGQVGYPLAVHGRNIAGPEDHAKRAFGNWQSDNAVDIAVPRGTAVYAVDDGEIVKLGGSWDGTGRSNPNGYNVTLKTADNTWFYTHLRYRKPLEIGQRVGRGTFLGGSGAANSADHLHIGCEHGNPVNLLGV